jgi:hypothetical protein
MRRKASDKLYTPNVTARRCRSANPHRRFCKKRQNRRLETQSAFEENEELTLTIDKILRRRFVTPWYYGCQTRKVLPPPGLRDIGGGRNHQMTNALHGAITNSSTSTSMAVLGFKNHGIVRDGTKKFYPEEAVLYRMLL